MGKFYEALRRSGNFRERTALQSQADNLLKLSSPSRVEVPDPVLSRSRTESTRISDAGIDPRLVSLLDPGSPASESFKMLRTKLLVLAREKRLRSIMVTSAGPVEGKSLTAANLAVSIASGMNDYVLLVDCDLRKPTLHKMFNLKNRSGIKDYLEAGDSIGPFLVKTSVGKLSLLPGFTSATNPSELLCSNKMRDLIEDLKSRYDDRYVIFDAPPGQFTAETAFLARMMDGVVFVVRYGRAAYEEISETVEIIGRERIFGVVFNASNERRREYRYYSRYYSRKKFQAGNP